MRDTIKKNLGIFLLLWIFFGFLAVIFVRYPFYDWLNYHYYNGWAFVNHRYGIDFMAANFRSYFIPYIDAVQYILLNALNSHPRIFLFIEAIDNALAFFLCYKIGETLLKDKKLQITFCIWGLLFFTGASAFIVLSEFSVVDVKLAIFCLLSFYILIKHLFSDGKNRMKWIFTAGIVLGIAISLKLTASTYFVTTILSILVLHRKIQNPVKVLCMFSLGVFTSFMILAGSWYYFIYSYYKNPVFPYFNNIFKSPFVNPIELLKDDFGHLRPHNFAEFIFYPFIISSKHYFGNDGTYFDPRYAMGIISVFVILFSVFRKTASDIFNNNQLCFLCLIILFSYYTNTCIFGTYRYITATLFLMIVATFIALYLICRNIPYKKFVYYLFLALILGTFASTRPNVKLINPLKLGKVTFVDNMNIKDNSVVLLASNHISFSVPFQNKKARYIVGILPYYILRSYKSRTGINDLKFYSRHLDSAYLYDRLVKVMDSDKNVYVAFKGKYKNLTNLYDTGLKYYSNGKRKIENCKEIEAKSYGQKISPLMICEYNKVEITNE